MKSIRTSWLPARAPIIASRTTDDLADVLRIDPHLEHPPTTQFLVLDGDIGRMRDDPADQMFECVGKHLGLAGLRRGDAGVGGLLGLLRSAFHRGLLGLAP